MTKRQRVWSRGSFTVPASPALGFVIVDPFLAVANNLVSLFTSSATSAGTGIDLTTGTTGLTTGSTNSEYVAATFGVSQASNQYRPVGAGLRIRYRDTELNRGGDVHALQHPAHLTLNGATIAQAEAYEECKRFSATRDWITLLYKPLNQKDLDLQGTFPTFTGGAITGTDNSYFMAFLIAGVAVSTTWEFEFYVVHEIIGFAVRGKLPSHVDYTGFSAVHTVSTLTPALAPSTQTDQEREESTLAKVGDYLKRGISWVWNHREQVEQIGSAIGSVIGI